MLRGWSLPQPPFEAKDSYRPFDWRWESCARRKPRCRCQVFSRAAAIQEGSRSVLSPNYLIARSAAGMPGGSAGVVVNARPSHPRET